MTLFVREYEWMWNRLQLSLAECRVYAYIYGLTHGAKGGYVGSKRGLATLLGLDHKGVGRILERLKDRNLISYTNNVWQSVSSPTDQGGDSVPNTCVDSVPENGDSVPDNGDSVHSPHTPLYNNIIDKKQADMQTFNFDKFFEKFTPEYKNRYAVTQYNFFQRSEAAQQAMMSAVENEPKGSVNKNPFFFVQDFEEPKPVFLRGDEPGEIVQVKYNDLFKLCTRQTAILFNLPIIKIWKV